MHGTTVLYDDIVYHIVNFPHGAQPFANAMILKEMGYLQKFRCIKMRLN